MEKTWNILVLNLGSTSSKVAYCQNDKIIMQVEKQHEMSELRALKTPEVTLAFYKQIIDEFIASLPIGMNEMDAIAVRGNGKMGAYKHGAYRLTPDMVNREPRNGAIGHKGLFSSSIIGSDLSEEYGIPAFLYDVVPVDELPLIATITGLANYRRRGASHTLNCRAVAFKVAKEMGKDPNKVTFLISHMGGGFTTLLYRDGRIIDTSSAEEGSFTPERVGKVGMSFMMELMRQNPAPEELDRILRRDVGIYGHLGTSDCREVERRIEAGDKKAEAVYQAMAYMVSKDLGAMAAAASGKVDAVILTGGIAHSKLFTGWIKDRLSFVAPVVVVPGAMEIEALAGGVTRVLNGEEAVNDYAEVRNLRPFEELEEK